MLYFQYQYLMTLAIPAPSVPLCINYVDTWYENLWLWTWSLLWFVMISMNSVKWIWRWFLLSQPKSTFTIMKDFKCNEDRQQVSAHEKVMHCLDRSVPSIASISFWLKPSQSWKSLSKASTKWPGQTVSAAKSFALSGQRPPIHCRHFILASACSIMKILVKSFHKVNMPAIQCRISSLQRHTGMASANFCQIGQF